MPAWLTDLQHLLVHGEIAVLVTLARTERAAPCAPGTKMIVTRESTWHTLGSAHFDQQATRLARQMLRDSPRASHLHPHLHPPAPLRRLERLTSPCAGALMLAFERLDAGDLGWLASLARRLAAGAATVRSVPSFSVPDDGPRLRFDAPPSSAAADASLRAAGPDASSPSSPSSGAENPRHASDAHHASHASSVLLSDPGPGAAASRLLLRPGPDGHGALLSEIIAPSEFPVVLFGVNPVSTALVRVLATLPCRVRWIAQNRADFAAPETLAALTTTPALTASGPAASAALGGWGAHGASAGHAASAAHGVPGVHAGSVVHGAPGAHAASAAHVPVHGVPAVHATPAASAAHGAHAAAVTPAGSAMHGAASGAPGVMAFTSGIAHLTVEATDAPAAVIDAAPANVSFIVMTHDHALDFTLAERILRRADFAFFGMLGARAKRGQLERQLGLHGIDPRQIARMHCPIGIAGITGKSPEIIALATAAQWLQAVQASQAGQQAPAGQANAAPTDAPHAQTSSPDQPNGTDCSAGPDPLCPE